MPHDQQTIMKLLMKKGEASLEELAAETSRDSGFIEEVLNALHSKGFVKKQIRDEIPLYSVSEIKKKVKKLSPDIWKALETKLKE